MCHAAGANSCVLLPHCRVETSLFCLSPLTISIELSDPWKCALFFLLCAAEVSVAAPYSAILVAHSILFEKLKNNVVLKSNRESIFLLALFFSVGSMWSIYCHFGISKFSYHF